MCAEHSGGARGCAALGNDLFTLGVHPTSSD
jgi:hypothetical protein